MVGGHLGARGVRRAAFERRYIPQWPALDRVPVGSQTGSSLPPRISQWPNALRVQRGLGATRDVHQGPLVIAMEAPGLGLDARVMRQGPAMKLGVRASNRKPGAP